jgi:nucleoid-associated protein YgaU
MKPGRAATGRNLLIAISLLALIPAAGCARRLSRAAADLDEEIETARRSCAENYAPEEFSRILALENEARANRLNGQRRKALQKTSEARTALTEALAKVADRKEDARRVAGEALVRAREAIELAANRGAPQDASTEFDRSREWFAEAESLFAKGECHYAEAATVALDAAALAGHSEEIATNSQARRLKQESEKSAREASRKRLSEEAEARRRRAAEERGRRPGRWVVAPGECLWLIAANRNVFGDPFQWPLIYSRNRGLIGDPDLIYPGQSFRIPLDATVQERQSAIRQARERVWPTPDYLFDGK